MNFSKRRSDGFDVRQFFGDPFHHAEEGTWVELARLLNILAFDAETHLKVFFVADEYVAQFDDASQSRLAGFQTTGNLPQLGSVVQVEADDRSSFFGGLHTFDDDFRSRRRKSGKDTAAVEPAAATGFFEDAFPVDIASFELSGGFVRTVVEDDRCPDSAALITVNCGHVRTVDAVVLVLFVERSDAHRSNAFFDQIAERVVDHGRRDAGVHAETVGEVGSTVELATGHVNRTLAGFAERDAARINAVNHGSKCEKVETTFGGNSQHDFSFESLSSFRICVSERTGPCRARGELRVSRTESARG